MRKRTSLLIIGAGGYGRTVLEAVRMGVEFEVAGFLDDVYPELGEACGLPVLGSTADLQQGLKFSGLAVVAIGCALGYNSETAPWEVYGPGTGFGE
ncbi:MAG: hypothetical protein SWH68_05125 [Thermodesulfobacteriota bacterium]|nr:hypothetical protein [Thermodesulfobacteriota bacterium]